jgi:hypothetical protein
MDQKSNIKNLLFFLLFFFPVLLSFGQTGMEKDFEKYAWHQDSLFTKAYDQRDVKTYQILLSDFLSRYNKLPDSLKKEFSYIMIDGYYNLCCTYSLLGDKTDALLYLKRSIDAGYYDYPHFQMDKDLDNIRNEKEFNSLIEPTRRIGDTLFILKHAAKYNDNDNRPLPEFIYPSENDSELVALRKFFKLDSVAGTANEISQILNVLHWLHNYVPHDGIHEEPTAKNYIELIAVCKKENKGLCCGTLAEILNSCYLSLGFKSRRIICLPKDSLGIDGDCHSIDVVYSNTLKKWIWVDPTFDAYVMNEKGELLSIEEVRERIIQDMPLIINPDANWNHKISETKGQYLSYMAKNLYILKCRAGREKKNGTVVSNYIELLPLDYFKQTPDKTEEKNLKTNVTFVTYKTNNPKLFWQAP